MIFSQRKISLEDFDIQNLQYFHYVNDEDWKINVFFAISDAKTISDKWKSFSDTIASIYQNSEYMSENKEFEKWNFYIIYVSKEKLSKYIKNKIENDRFSSRKIVENYHSLKFNDDEANKLIIKHITNTDLKEIVDATIEVNISKYVPVNPDLWKLLDTDDKVIGDKEAQEFIVKELNKK